MPFILLEATCYGCVLPLQMESWTDSVLSLSFCLSGHTLLLPTTDKEKTFSFTYHRFFYSTADMLENLGVWQTSDIPYLTSGSCRQNYFWLYCLFIKDKMQFSCSLLVASDKITSLPYSWFIMDKVPFPFFLLEAADFIYQGSIVTLADSKIDSFKFYYCEKSENLHSCSFIYWLYHFKSSKA